MASAVPVTDHDTIREWAEARGGKPACVRGTGGKGDPGMIRIDFPGFSGEGKLHEISWDEWFEQFEANNLALLMYPDVPPGRDKSNFNKLVSRSTATAAGQRSGKRTSSRKRAKAPA